jgi:hypothetical protein
VSAKAPDGYQINGDRARLDAAAKAYMNANPGVSYLDAFKAIQKGA